MLSYVVHIAFNNHYRECMDLIEAPEGDWKCDTHSKYGSTAVV